MSLDPQVKQLLSLNVGPRAARPGKTPGREEVKAAGEYVVAGVKRVFGRVRGQTVSVAHLTVAQLEALVESGHLKKVVPPAAAPAAPATPAAPAADTEGK